MQAIRTSFKVTSISTLEQIAPDGLRRRLCGRILSMLEEVESLRLLALKVLIPRHEVLEAHYHEHKDKPFYSDLMAYVGSGDPVLASAWIGTEAVQKTRDLIGCTDPALAQEEPFAPNLLCPREKTLFMAQTLLKAEKMKWHYGSLNRNWYQGIV
ncbi:Nucleoside diphosphate kinase [Caligus rogercresseyi]|uniref:nucleoside-diphosphate kinase n=1 Tax=Caligus rogercresseyi TaxID=217165 RepID=A0A7T8KG14_CALRO|nr:Nucleoside diphosphate kinase [Caligus rogercresseyi]